MCYNRVYNNKSIGYAQRFRAQAFWTYINLREWDPLCDGRYFDLQLWDLFPEFLHLLHGLASFLQKSVGSELLSAGPKTFLGFDVRSHVCEVQLLLQRADFALRLHCLDPVVALGRVKSCPLVYSMNFCNSFVGNGLSELGFTKTYSTLYSYWQIIFWKKTPIASKSF